MGLRTIELFAGAGVATGEEMNRENRTRLSMTAACKVQRMEAQKLWRELREQLRMSDIARQHMADALVAVGVEASPGWGLERLAEALRDVTPMLKAECTE